MERNPGHCAESPVIICPRAPLYTLQGIQETPNAAAKAVEPVAENLDKGHNSNILEES